MSYTAIMGDVSTNRPPRAGGVDDQRSELSLRESVRNGDRDLIFDWNELHRKGRLVPQPFSLLDETLRDGLQNPSVNDPSIDDKLKILHLMDDLGIEHANIGLPGSGKRAYDDVLTLAREVASSRLRIQIAAAGRTVASDIAPILDISQRAGVAIEVCAFIGSSPIRQFVEQWDVALIAKRSADAIDLAAKSGLPVAYVTEDTTRSRPEVLSTLFRAAIDHGAKRLVLTDTVGHATPDGVRNLMQFTRSVIAGTGVKVGIDWHGHDDRGLGLGNALWALEHGADRVHGTALGIGERVGNPALELILLNLRLLGQLPADRDLTRLVEYCETVARAVGWEIPRNYPLVGRDSFRTATGVHAAAIIKAMQRGDAWLADRVYSGVPAGTFGRKQEIAVGFMSGASNVAFWLRQRNIEPSEGLVDAILETAKGTRHLLTDEEIMAVVSRHR
jgi:2-isopropylmalate synthase